MIRWAVNLDWADVPLGSLVSERQEVREAARTSALPLLSEHVAIEFGEVQYDAVILGVAALLLTNELGLSVSR